MNNKLAYLLIGPILLTGCASRPFDYEGIAKRAAIASVCERERLITSGEFSSYTSFQLGEYAGQYSHDPSKLRSMYLDQVQESRKYTFNTDSDRDLLRMHCAEISTVAKRVAPNNNAARQNSSPAYQYQPPTTTNCMTTYGWTRCTTN